MAFSQPVLPFLRPLGPPRPSFIRHFLRFSQSSRRAEDPNLVASETASPSYPPPGTRSIPRPKKSRASHQTSNPSKTLETSFPAGAEKSASEAATSPVTSTESQPLRKQKLPYHISRTPTNNLPIYHTAKRGGNLHETRIRKISGSVQALRDDLQKELGVQNKDCTINTLTGHIIVKGWHKGRVTQFLLERQF
ncbi:mitochondrial large subunit ribosomal protein-domain-containing protein [Cryomyces antarcticus]